MEPVCRQSFSDVLFEFGLPEASSTAPTFAVCADSLINALLSVACKILFSDN